MTPPKLARLRLARFAVAGFLLLDAAAPFAQEAPAGRADFPGSSVEAASPFPSRGALLAGPISTHPDLLSDCSVISDSLNHALHTRMSHCQVAGDTVLIGGNPQAIDNYDRFFSVSFLAAGITINEGLYEPKTQFIVGNEHGGRGCLALNGAQAANYQRKFDAAAHWAPGDAEKADQVAHDLLSQAQPVACPAFLRADEEALGAPRSFARN